MNIIIVIVVVDKFSILEEIQTFANNKRAGKIKRIFIINSDFYSTPQLTMMELMQNISGEVYVDKEGPGGSL